APWRRRTIRPSPTVHPAPVRSWATGLYLLPPPHLLSAAKAWLTHAYYQEELVVATSRTSDIPTSTHWQCSWRRFSVSHRPPAWDRSSPPASCGGARAARAAESNASTRTCGTARRYCLHSVLGV